MRLFEVRLATLIFRQDAPIPILAELSAATPRRASGFVQWPKCEVPPDPELVCFSGNTGSDGSCAKAREVFQN